MWSRRIIVALLGILVGIIDVAVSVWFPGPWAAVRSVLPFVIVLAVFSSRERAVTAAIAAGLVIDVLVPSFGLVTLRLTMVAFVIHALAQRFFSNRSLPGSFALGVAGILIDRALVFGVTTLAGAWTSRTFVTEVRVGWFAETVWMTAVMALSFFGVAALTRRFLPPVTRR